MFDQIYLRFIKKLNRLIDPHWQQKNIIVFVIKLCSNALVLANVKTIKDYNKSAPIFSFFAGIAGDTIKNVPNAGLIFLNHFYVSVFSLWWYFPNLDYFVSLYILPLWHAIKSQKSTVEICLFSFILQWLHVGHVS